MRTSGTKGRAAVVAIGVVVSLVAAACSSDGDSAPPTSEAVPTTGAPTATAPEGGSTENTDPVSTERFERGSIPEPDAALAEI